MTAIIDALADIFTNTLDLDVEAAELTADTTLFHDGLGLDSIDVLELVVGIEERWGVKIDSRELGEKVLQTVGTLAEYIEAHRSDT